MLFRSIAAFGPGSYEKPGVPQGKVSEKIVHQSKIYPGMTNDYWVYVPAQYNASTPAALMVWQDGQGYITRPGNSRLLIVLDNLMHEKKIPVAIQVFISPGMVGQRRLRSVQYDSVDDVYARYLRDEVLKDVESKYNIRKDGYSRFIAGESSGAIRAGSKRSRSIRRPISSANTACPDGLTVRWISRPAANSTSTSRTP